MKRNIIIDAICHEIKQAKKQHPVWPTDKIHAAAIVAEESGELVRATLNHVYENAPERDIKKEAIQTAATCIRLLENL